MLNYLALLGAAAIWGFAFVAQRKGMQSLDPFTFNALRFALGALCIMLARCAERWPTRKARSSTFATRPARVSKEYRREPVILGLLLFFAASLQQVGMLWTGAGNAGFITGLYVVIVPILGLWRGQKLLKGTIVAVLLAVAGLWFINSAQRVNASLGNLLVLCGAVFWALHVQMIDKLASRHSSLELARVQYLVCAGCSLAFGVLYRGLFIPAGFDLGGLVSAIRSVALPLLYAGIFSVGIAFTLQIQAQKKVAPQAASVILCSEAVFALLGGHLLLGEELTAASLLGAALLLAAMLSSVLSGWDKIFLVDKKPSRRDWYRN